MSSDGRPAIRGRRLGTALRKHRESLRFDLKDAAEAVGCSTSKISRLESGLSPARVGDVRILLDLYQIQDAELRGRLESLARQSNKRGWWADYQATVKAGFTDFVTLEADASFIRTWQTMFIPGILQTPEYTRALFESNPAAMSEEMVKEGLKIRQERRRTVEEAGTRIAAVIWEHALTSPMPSRSDHRKQIEHIVKVARRRSTTVQILPQGQWDAARIASPFVAFSFDEEWAPEIVALDALGGMLLIEDEEELARYGHAFDTLRSAALSPEESLAFLRQTADGISQEEAASE
ncbi:Helix-turn-helix domain-containing protein [Streptomyces sp. yr375]|nr:Helix-turn-helix domain-containing protein [Streptomyces sp. yr375]